MVDHGPAMASSANALAYLYHVLRTENMLVKKHYCRSGEMVWLIKLIAT